MFEIVFLILCKQDAPDNFSWGQLGKDLKNEWTSDF